MITGMSIRSFAISASRFLSDARSGDPGAYERTGSLTGGGTRRVPVNPTTGAGVCAPGDGAWPTALSDDDAADRDRRGLASRTGMSAETVRGTGKIMRHPRSLGRRRNARPTITGFRSGAGFPEA